jgi:hypothetical protein
MVPVSCGGAAGCLGDGGGGDEVGGMACCGGVCGSHITNSNRVSLGELNNDATFDASNILNSYISDDENVSQFFSTQIGSKYLDAETFSTCFKGSKAPLILSINIQSLNSKYEKLKLFMETLRLSKVPVDVLILQETWDIKYPAQLTIPGFQNIVYHTREKGRGGGVGMYIRTGLNFKERPDLELYRLKTF